LPEVSIWSSALVRGRSSRSVSFGGDVGDVDRSTRAFASS
jgi:hypothetical protein